MRKVYLALFFPPKKRGNVGKMRASWCLTILNSLGHHCSVLMWYILLEEVTQRLLKEGGHKNFVKNTLLQWASRVESTARMLENVSNQKTPSGVAHLINRQEQMMQTGCSFFEYALVFTDPEIGRGPRTTKNNESAICGLQVVKRCFSRERRGSAGQWRLGRPQTLRLQSRLEGWRRVPLLQLRFRTERRRSGH